MTTTKTTNPTSVEMLEYYQCAANGKHTSFYKEATLHLDQYGHTTGVEEYSPILCGDCGSQTVRRVRPSYQKYIQQQLLLTPSEAEEGPEYLFLEKFEDSTGTEVEKFFVPLDMSKGFIVTSSEKETRVHKVYDLVTDKMSRPEAKDLEIFLDLIQ